MNPTPSIADGSDGTRESVASGSVVHPAPAEPATQVQLGLGRVGVASAADGKHEIPIHDENIGERLDHFELLDCIGVGGMGRVYRGIDSRLDRMVAIKVLSPDLATDNEVLRRFEQEAKAAARIESPYFARVHFFGCDKQKHYIAMEFVEGEDLRRKIARLGRLDVDSVVRIGIQIARGLMDSERVGVVHRDIKPSNIIVDDRGVAKLVDMGLARSLLPRSGSDDDITQAGVTLGTFDYISPEQGVDPRNADIRSDIYSLGCTLYHALAGRPPFGEGTPLQKLMSHQNEAIPDLRSTTPTAPDSLVRLIDRMTAKDPSQRHQSPSELLADFSRLAAALGIDASEAIREASQPRAAFWRWQDHASWLGPTALIALTAFAMAYAQRPRPRAVSTAPVFVASSTAAPTDMAIESAKPAPAAKADAQDSGKTPPRSPDPRSDNIIDVPAEPQGDLRVAIAEARRGATLRLLGTAYRLVADADAEGTIGAIIDKDLTICGIENGLTSIELVEEPDAFVPANVQRSLFTVAEGTLRLERLRLRCVSPAILGDGGACIIVERGECVASKCSFAMAGGGNGATGSVVRLGHPTVAASAGFQGYESYFSVGGIAIEMVGSGRFNVRLEDCGFRDVRRLLMRKGTGAAAFTAEHVSFFALDAPVFDLERLDNLQIVVRESVFSQMQRGNAQPLVHIELPGNRGAEVKTWWTGERNLYHGFESGLADLLNDAADSDFLELARIGFRESQSKRFGASRWPWLLNDPRRDAENAVVDAAQAFRMSVNSEGLKHDRSGGPIGMRSSPWGKIYGESAGAPANAAFPSGAEAIVVNRLPKPLESKPTMSTLTVDPSVLAGDQPRGVFRSLSTACDEAPDGGVIELKGNKDFSVSETRISSKRLTVRSAAGSRPRLLFEPIDEAPAARIVLGANADVKFEDLTVVFRAVSPARAPAAFMEAASGATLSLENCRIEVDGATDTALFLGRNPASVAGVLGSANRPAQFNLRRCFVSAGYLARFDPGTPIRFLVEDSQVHCEHSVFRLDGGSIALIQSESRYGVIAISRTTIATRECLIDCSRGDRGAVQNPLSLDIALNRAAIVGIGGFPMIRIANERMGNLDSSGLTFQGQMNFFAGFDVFLQVAHSDASGMLQRPYRFVEWIERTQLDRDSNSQGEADAAQVFGAALPQAGAIGPEELRRLGYRGTFSSPPGYEAPTTNSGARLDATRF